MHKILFLIESLSGGGAEKVLSTLIEHIDKTKFDVTLCCVVDTGKYVEEVKPYVHYNYILPNPSEQKGFKTLLYKIKYVLVYKLLPLSLVYRWYVPKCADVEVAFVEGFATKILSYSDNIKAKRIAWLHTDFSHHHWTLGPVFRSVDEEIKCYERFNQVITVSDTAKKAFRAIFPSLKVPVTTIYNPINNEHILRQSLEPIDEELKENDVLRIVSVGRLTAIKAFDRLLRIVGKLKRQNYKVELWLLGEGEKRKELESIILQENIGDIVTLWGFQSNPYKYMVHCDLFVCSSIGEGYSTAVTEALILGLPVVTTDCSGMAELLIDGECGIITDNSEEALYYGVKSMLDSSDVLNEYKEKASHRGRDFSISSLMKPIENCFYYE